MKSLSSFLSQDEIVLEELNLQASCMTVSFSFVLFTRAELKPIEEVIVDGILTHIYILTDSSFDTDLQTWRTELVPLFISRCELLCFTQDLNISQDSLFHYLGFIFFKFFNHQIAFLGVCLYDTAELLFPCFTEEEEEEGVN